MVVYVCVYDLNQTEYIDHINIDNNDVAAMLLEARIIHFTKCTIKGFEIC